MHHGSNPPDAPVAHGPVSPWALPLTVKGLFDRLRVPGATRRPPPSSQPSPGRWRAQPPHTPITVGHHDRRASDTERVTTGDKERGCLHLVALDDGEAACLAVAVERGWTLATDDGDALRVLERLAHDHPYERIRRLLVRAAADGLVTEAEANEIHEEMTRAGFWDRVRPFSEP